MSEIENQPSGAGATQQRWMHRHPRKALLLVNLIGLLLLSLIAEVSLRAMGMQPGMLDLGWINFAPLPADSTLRVSHEFYTDSLGIFKACAEHATGYPVNADGFRGPEFLPNDSSRKKIMLIGDSFTWGAHAEPLDSSFADRLRRPDWQVMNMGIPGADPDQYAQVAKHYIPILQPDLVCVFYYMANDKMALPQTVGPFENRYHITNVGWINAFMDGPYLGDAQATYDYCLQKLRIPETTFFNRLCAKTSLGTLVWRGLVRIQWIAPHYPESIRLRLEHAKKLQDQGPYGKSYLEEIQQLCDARKIPFLLFFIPAHNQIALPDSAECARLFPKTEILMPADITIDDYYPRPDGHYNNAGHRKMARYAAQKIQEHL